MSLNSQPVRDNAFHVCVDKDRVLRFVETEEPCPEGQQRLRLQEAGTPDVDPPKDTDDKQEDRKKLEPAAKVQAPFEVVDSAGKPIIRVSDTLGPELSGRGMEVYGATGPPVAFVVADSGGHGVVRVDSAGRQMSTGMFSYDGAAGLRVREGDRIRVEVGRGDAGSYGTRVFGSAATPMAFLGLSTSSIPTVMVSNGGSGLAYLGLTNQKRGIVGVANSSNSAVASLSEGGDGGKLQILDQSGTTVVEAGVLPGGAGVVRAGPSAFADRAGLVRLSELRGKR